MGQDTVVTIPQFQAAVVAERGALEAFDTASDRMAIVREAFEALQCRVVIRWEDGTLAGPGEDPADCDYWVEEAPCALPAEHDGDHDRDPSEAPEAPDAYRAAHASLGEASRTADELLGRWHDAERALDELRCGHVAAGEWPCTARRGHGPAEPHVYPREIRLMPEPLWIVRDDEAGQATGERGF